VNSLSNTVCAHSGVKRASLTIWPIRKLSDDAGASTFRGVVQQDQLVGRFRQSFQLAQAGFIFLLHGGYRGKQTAARDTGKNARDVQVWVFRADKDPLDLETVRSGFLQQAHVHNRALKHEGLVRIEKFLSPAFTGPKADQPAISPSAEEWLTASEAAAHLKVKPRTILQWAKDGKIRGHVLSGTKRCTWRFLRSELDAILAAPSAALVNGRIQ
jgi:excisionase family DNA binding protein